MLRPIVEKLPLELQKIIIERGLKRILRSGAFSYIAKVILFGSGARSELTEISDLDFCVLARDATDLKLIKRFIANASRESGDETVYDILVFDSEAFRKKSSIGGVCQIIHEDGLVVYCTK